MCTCVFELTGLPYVFLNFAHFFLVHKEKVGHLTEMCNLSSEREVMQVFQCVVKPYPLVSTVLEMLEVVVCLPRVFSLIMVRECI